MAATQANELCPPPLVDALHSAARLIEQTFNLGCDRLGEGLVLFATLKDNFGDLGKALASADMDATRATLRRLARELDAVAQSLSGEARMLQDMADYDAAASKALVELRQHLQIIGVLARSTRIEAASFDADRLDIRSFTDRIIGLTGQTKTTVDDCLRDHDRLSALLANAMSQQCEFMQRYQRALSSVAAKLRLSELGLKERAEWSLALTATSAARAEMLSCAVGNAVVSMQSGDNIRQRLEHVVAGLASIRQDGAEPGEREQSEFARVIERLQSEQLREAGAALSTDLRHIDAALAALERDGSLMVREARSHFGGAERSANSFLDSLESELAEASLLIEKCEAARAGVDQATRALSRMLEEFQQTVSALSETIQDIAMIGTNAGLLAKRLGVSGRGLVVIAGEVKKIADEVDQDAIRLRPIFTFLQTAAAALREHDSGSRREMAELDSAMRQSLRNMRESGAHLGAALNRLATAGGQFTQIVGDCRGRFADLGAVAAFLPGAAETLDAGAAVAPIARDEVFDVEDRLRREVFTRYTMSDERDIHRRVLEEFDLAHDLEAEERRVA